MESLWNLRCSSLQANGAYIRSIFRPMPVRPSMSTSSICDSFKIIGPRCGWALVLPTLPLLSRQYVCRRTLSLSGEFANESNEWRTSRDVTAPESFCTRRITAHHRASIRLVMAIAVQSDWLEHRKSLKLTWLYHYRWHLSVPLSFADCYSKFILQE